MNKINLFLCFFSPGVLLGLAAASWGEYINYGKPGYEPSLALPMFTLVGFLILLTMLIVARKRISKMITEEKEDE